MSLTAPAQSAVGTPLLSQSPVDIRPQDTDVSALPPLRLRHPARLDMRLRFERPKRPRPDCGRGEDGTVKAEPSPGRECLMSVGGHSYRYLGSTTCPYTTGVRWTVLTHPVQASAAALEHYRDLFPEGNAREVQPLGDRRIAGDRHRWW